MVVLFTMGCSRTRRAGVPWYLIWAPLLIFGGSVCHPWLSFWNPNFVSFTISRLSKQGGYASVNNNINVYFAPPCELGSALRHLLLRVLFLRQKHGRNARTTVDVKDALRYVLVYPAGAPVFVYVVGGHVVVGLWLPFGWGNSTGCREVGGVGARSFSHSLYVSKRSRVPTKGGCRRARRTRSAARRFVRAAPGGSSAGARRGGSHRQPFFRTVLRRRRHPCRVEMAPVAGGRCNRSRRTTFACWANVKHLTLPSCLPEKSLSGILV